MIKDLWDVLVGWCRPGPPAPDPSSLPALLREVEMRHHGPRRRAALAALGEIDSPLVAAPILAALDESDREVWAAAAMAAGRRRLHAARPALERLSEYYAPQANPDYVPESWAQERVEREFLDVEADEIRATAAEALRRLDGG